ncbi:MAG: hypothetical protein OEO21_02460 [Candidatus Krumholzibacteria bacterium]|nr:hypothetical protein [Candidatus Krumholzibacteria bacterium]
MMRALCLLAALAFATTAVAGTAGEMTPQQAMEKMNNCPVCSAWSKEAGVTDNIRYDIIQTKNGYVETFMSADEKMMPAFEKCGAECEKRMAAIPTMSKEQMDKLCPFCVGQGKLASRTDLGFEMHKTHMGWVSVASSSTPDGVKALHDYAAAAKKHADLLAQAGAEKAKKDVQKAKM